MSYSAQTTFESIYDRPNRNLVVDANGGTVTIEAQVGANWILTDTFSADGGNVVQQGLLTLRITPTGSAVFDYQ